MNYFDDSGMMSLYVKTKDNGELVGIYQENGKAASGTLSINYPGGLLSLKNGKPVTGTVNLDGRSYYLDAETGFLRVNWM